MTPSTAVAFLIAGRPPTANKTGGSRRPAFVRRVREGFVSAGGAVATQPCYGLVYYFVQGYRPSNDADADNISKPVWDALKGTAYDDDKIVRLRIAAVVDTGSEPGGPPALTDLGLSDMRPDLASHLVEMIGAGKRHILYVEIGRLDPRMLRFGLADGMITS